MILPVSIPSPDVSYFAIAGLRIHIYALCIMVGIVAAILLTNRRLTRRGGEPWVVLDFAFWTVILGIVGARAYHVLTHPNDYFYEGANFWNVVAVNQGGIAIFGALLGGAVGALIACKFTGIRFLSFADALVPGLLLAQAFGRLGNWFNHEIFGTPTTLPWGLEIESSNPAFPLGLAEGTLFHPTFLYEIIWNLLGVVVILYVERRLRTHWGETLALYLVWYGIGRAAIESIRLDPSEVFLGIRVNLWTALLAILLGLVLFIVQRRRHTGVEPSVYRPSFARAVVSSEDENAYYSLNRSQSEPGEQHTAAEETATSEESAPA
ncbi:prolipoprotein diacylglyceryl transferase [Klugiella xanthotipulae]|uniref:Phosphatidylglycerol--prolipoprotein diacylglyceryl transferase n=1 Tax=Klugiella xanthotipulae TaxID=244735 RepID=A0A543HSN2_9MICO|nr:prolipoprotein diacylglyceryl transferase [Klugiella xanthotipulae]